MSGANQLTLIDAEGPEYYAELLCKVPRPTNRRLPSDGRSCPDIRGIQKGEVCRLVYLGCEKGMRPSSIFNR